MKGLIRSLARGSAVRQPIMKLRFPVRALPISIVGASGVGFGFANVGALPQGNLLFLGAVSYLRFSKNGDSDIQDAFDGDFAIGTAGTVDVDVSDADEATIIPATAFPAPAAAGLSAVLRGASTDALGGGIIDNTDGSKNVVLNLLIDDANISGTASMLVEGYVDIAVIVLGDD
jgi:hypothetical protein